MIDKEIIEKFQLKETNNQIGDSKEFGLIIYNYKNQCLVIEDCEHSGFPKSNYMLKFFVQNRYANVTIELLYSISDETLYKLLCRHQLLPNNSANISERTVLEINPPIDSKLGLSEKL